MSKLIRKSGPAVSFVARLSALPIALLACATFASAQTAPQLLPYTSVLVAGGAATNPAKGAVCPASGNTSLDAFGDGCLATEINIAPSATAGTGARYAIADKTGAIFFSDATNSLVRRIDPVTGIVTVVAGGAASTPAAGTACGTGISTDADGDGCPANLVKISKPMGLAFDAAGNLYFADNGFDDVRKIAATGGVITTTGIITNIAGGPTFGYNVNNTSTTGPVIAATQSYLNFPYGIAFDSNGNLYISDEGNNALEVVNMGTTTLTLQGMSVPAGTIAKFAGYGSLAAKTATSGDCPDFVSTSARGGCYFGKWTDGTLGNVSNIDGGYSLSLDSNNNVYFGNEFNNDVGLITTGNVISNFAGIQATAAKKNVRGVAGSFGIGSIFGVAMDTLNNLYVTDASSGFIWRVDAAGKLMYVVGGGASTVCTNATDTYGDGCPATQATFGSSSGTGNFASTALPGPGIFGVGVDAFADLFVGDTETGLIRKVASGTQFGPVGANQPTDIVEIHFAASDAPVSSGAYTLTAGATNFKLGTATCSTNSDNTTDCLLPVTATPTVLGPFTGTLTVKAQLGGTSNFPLSGTFVTSPLTRTTVSYSTGGTACGTSTIFGTNTQFTLTANVISTGTPTGTVTFFANGTQVGTPQTVSNSTAKLTTTFSTPGTYNITAMYNGDTNFKPSTSTATSFTTSSPGFTTTIATSTTTPIVAGQTGLYSFTVAQNVYTGTITFACSGLPAGATCVFSPASITASGCSVTNTVALNIYTTQPKAVGQSGIVGTGRGVWRITTVLAGMLMALMLGLRRRTLRFRQVWLSLALLGVVSGLAACGSRGFTTGTPSGNYTITVTTTGSSGTPATFTVPLIVQ